VDATVLRVDRVKRAEAPLGEAGGEVPVHDVPEGSGALRSADQRGARRREQGLKVVPRHAPESTERGAGG
jgi:hypothetical protein